jgi:release factor glutamine methyltransferase
VDLIVSNPPYVPLSEASTLTTQVRDHEPHLALFVNDEDPLLFYRAIAEHAQAQMKAGGSLWFEGHHQYSRAVAELLREMNFQAVALHRDLSGNDRFIEART